MQSKHTLDKEYFKTIDSPDKAYWMGFIWCDGYLAYRNRNGWITYDFKLSLSEEDIEHLELFKSYLKSDHVVRKYEVCGFASQNKEARLLICNKDFGKTLYENYGLVPNRCDASLVIDKIPHAFRYHFIRGIMDADGLIAKRDIKYKTTNATEYSIGFTTCESLLVYINNVFLQDGLTKTKYKLVTRHDGRDGHCRSLRITGNTVVKNILTKIYESSDNLRLMRKYNKYIGMIQYVKEKETERMRNF